MASNIIYQTIISSRAEDEIISSWKWYETQQQKLGDRFFYELSLKLEKITQNPEQYSARYKNYREATLSVFPFSIIYRINKKKKAIFIISVFHSKRNPKKRYSK